MKKIAVLPALLTLGNGVCGFVAIVFASKQLCIGLVMFSVLLIKSAWSAIAYSTCS